MYIGVMDTMKCTLEPSRGMDLQNLTNGFTKILVKINEENVKETLTKLKLKNTIDVNMKILNDINVKTLAETLEWFGVEVKEYNKSGLVFNILLEVAKILPYLCGGCSELCNPPTPQTPGPSGPPGGT